MSARTVKKTYDVLILGTGLGGTILGAILARHGMRVLMIDASTHPRFAVGESTIPYTSILMRLISARYDVPEIKHLASFHSVRKHVTKMCGIKRNFGFVYHREGKQQDPSEVNQFVIPGNLNVENHYFRQDIDAYMLHVAIHYGAEVRQSVKIDRIETSEDRVVATANNGEEFEARYVYDACGYRSILADQFGLRENPPPFKHHARSIFTHMVEVEPYDKFAVPAPRQWKNPSPWHEGTLHHLFEGGWLWVIPFNNYPGALNPLCSVGLNLDPRIYPRPVGVEPEQEFRDFIARFPQMGLQFKNARSVRQWVATDRIQYGSTATVGHRWCMSSHSSGFIDPLFSRGLTNTLEIINALAYRLLDALKTDDFSIEKFAYLSKLNAGLLKLNDDVVYLSYVSLKDFHLWNAAYRVWGLGAVLGTSLLERAYLSFLKNGDPSVFVALEDSPRTGIPLPRHPALHAFLETANEAACGVAEGKVNPKDAGDKIFDMLANGDFVPPVFGFHRPEVRFFHPTPLKVPSTLWWSYRKTSPEVGSAIRSGLKAFAMRTVFGD